MFCAPSCKEQQQQEEDKTGTPRSPKVGHGRKFYPTDRGTDHRPVRGGSNFLRVFLRLRSIRVRAFSRQRANRERASLIRANLCVCVCAILRGGNFPHLYKNKTKDAQKGRGILTNQTVFLTGGVNKNNHMLDCLHPLVLTHPSVIVCHRWTKGGEER